MSLIITRAKNHAEEALSPSSGQQAHQAVERQGDQVEEAPSGADSVLDRPEVPGPLGAPVHPENELDEQVRRKVMSLLAGAG